MRADRYKTLLVKTFAVRENMWRRAGGDLVAALLLQNPAVPGDPVPSGTTYTTAAGAGVGERRGRQLHGVFCPIPVQALLAVPTILQVYWRFATNISGFITGGGGGGWGQWPQSTELQVCLRLLWWRWRKAIEDNGNSFNFTWLRTTT